MRPLTTPFTPARPISPVDPAPPPAAVQWPPARPQLLREYARADAFHRHAAQLARSGWVPMTVQTSGSPRLHRVLNALTLGLYGLVTRVEPTLLVTYSTQ